jgi:hypothetical protein
VRYRKERRRSGGGHREERGGGGRMDRWFGREYVKVFFAIILIRHLNMDGGSRKREYQTCTRSTSNPHTHQKKIEKNYSQQTH